MSDTVRQIAMRIRELREISDCPVEEVAKAIGIPTEQYIRYEKGKEDIPISVLLSLSQFFKVDTHTILTGEAPRLNVYALTRAGKGMEINRREHYKYLHLAHHFARPGILPLHVTVDPGTNPEMATSSHPGQEFDFVLEGVLRLKVGDTELTLYPGDCIFYDSMHPHAMQAIGDTPVKLLAMVIP